MKWYKHTDEDFVEAAKNSKSIAGMCKYLGRTPYGSGYYMMRKKIEELHIDTSHFTGKGWNTEGKNLVKNKKTPDEEVFCENSNFQKSRLKERLISGGYKEEKCEKCGRTEWNGEKIPLETHHINGVQNDNRIENLMLLCPNCHAQTDNYCSKNKNKKRVSYTKNVVKKIEKICPICGKTFFASRQRQKYCSKECSYKALKKEPDFLEIENVLREKTTKEVAEIFNVTDKTVRKWRKKYGLYGPVGQ